MPTAAVCSGKLQMTVSGPEGDGAAMAAADRVREVIALLEEALRVVDDAGLPPQIGARISEALDEAKASH